jgi:Na+/H+ antiporter NhaD/arsenite permease-like protein
VLGSALAAAGPAIAFLAAAMTLAFLAARSGLAERLAAALAAAGSGRPSVLFAWVCAAAALLTSALSLDGAVVLMLPVLITLRRSHGAPFRPLLLATVGVANAFSAALPAGNPTNLVLMERIGVSPAAFTERMAPPSLAAAAACAGTLWALERRALGSRYPVARPIRGAVSREERIAAIGLAAAALADWLSPLAGVSPWLPVSAIACAALAVAGGRPRVAVPWRIAVQVTALLVALSVARASLGVRAWALDRPSLVGLTLVAGAVGAGAALANNLPASAVAASLLAPGAASWAALVGLSSGALATPHGSVATLISLDLSGDAAPAGIAGSLAAAGLAAVCAGTVLLWLT